MNESDIWYSRLCVQLFFLSLAPPSVPKCWVEGSEEKGGSVSLRCKSYKGTIPLTYVWRRESGGAMPSTATQGKKPKIKRPAHSFFNVKNYVCWFFIFFFFSFNKTQRLASSWSRTIQTATLEPMFVRQKILLAKHSANIHCMHITVSLLYHLTIKNSKNTDKLKVSIFRQYSKVLWKPLVVAGIYYLM